MATVNRKKLTVTFKNIMNESQSDDVTYAANRAKCEYDVFDYNTKIVVKAKNEKQLDEFIKLYNA